jgi:hypothetical protein
MDREECYKILRDMGVSVETADAMAERLAKEPPRKQEALLLWASGLTFREIEIKIKMPRSTICDLVIKMRTNP